MLAPVMEVLARFTPPAVHHAGNRYRCVAARWRRRSHWEGPEREKLHGAGRACSLWLFGKPAGCQSNQQFGRCLTSYHQIGAALVCPTSARRCVRVCGATILQGRLLGAGVGERGAADACTCCLRWCTAPVAMLASRLVRVLTAVAVCVALFVAAEGAGGVITAAVTRDMEKVRLSCVASAVLGCGCWHWRIGCAPRSRRCVITLVTCHACCPQHHAQLQERRRRLQVFDTGKLYGPFRALAYVAGVHIATSCAISCSMSCAMTIAAGAGTSMQTRTSVPHHNAPQSLWTRGPLSSQSRVPGT